MRAQQLSESRGGRPELPAPNTSNCPYDVCGRKATLDEEEDNKTARTKDKRRGTCSKLVKCANNNFCDRALREVLTEAGCFSRDLVRDTLHFHLPIHYIFICCTLHFHLARRGLVCLNVCQHVQSIKIRLKENEIKAILVTYLLGHVCMFPRTKHSALRSCVQVPI